MKKIIYLVLTVSTIIIWYGCKKAERVDYTDPNAPAPAQISDVVPTSTPGGVILKYKIPNDPNFSYAKAVYEIQPGVFRETKSSVYNDTLSLAGYGDTNDHEVKIYSVGKNEKASEPISVTVKPGIAPVNSIFASLSLTATFGGVNIQFTNPLEANIAIDLLVDSSGKGTWAPIGTFYSGAKQGNFSARNLPPKEQKFAIYLKDRYNNKSAALEKLLTPLAEQLLPKSSFKALFLPTDAPSAGGLRLENVYDNQFGYAAYASSRTQARPEWITLDMGNTAVLSRLKLFSVTEHCYSDGGVKSFEIWGTATIPRADGSFDGWTKLGTFEANKPSGKPLGQVTPEDLNYGSFLGDDINFPAGIPAVRYLRFKTLENYGGDGLVVISELSFWGQIQ
jgi:uncharacterized protein DUF5000/uncharacterized protein DUF4959/uncharacterized protein DUF5126